MTEPYAFRQEMVIFAVGHLIQLLSDLMLERNLQPTKNSGHYGESPCPAPPVSHHVGRLCIVLFLLPPDTSSLLSGSSSHIHCHKFFHTYIAYL